MEIPLMVTYKWQTIKFCKHDLNERWFFTTILCWSISKILLNYNKFWYTCNFFQTRLLRLIIALTVVHGCSFNVKSCNKDKQLKARNRSSEIISIQSLRQPQILYGVQLNSTICDCLSENLPSSHLLVFRETPF